MNPIRKPTLTPADARKLKRLATAYASATANLSWRGEISSPDGDVLARQYDAARKRLWDALDNLTGTEPDSNLNQT